MMMEGEKRVSNAGAFVVFFFHPNMSMFLALIMNKASVSSLITF